MEPPLVAAMLGMGYLVGFVVSNVYLGQYKILTFDLLRGRYLAAALLWALFTLVPVVVGMLLATVVVAKSTADDPLTIWDRAKGLVSSMAAAVVSSWVFSGVFALVSVDRSVASQNRASAYFALSLLVGAGVRTFAEVLARKPSAHRSVLLHVVGFYPAGVTLVFLVLATMFGQLVYPSLRAEYGGGSAWLAQITPKDSLLPVVARGPVGIVERDDKLVSVVVCDGGSPPSVRRVVVPLESVRSAELLRPITIPGYAAAHCADRAAKPRPSTQATRR